VVGVEYMFWTIVGALLFVCFSPYILLAFLVVLYIIFYPFIWVVQAFQQSLEEVRQKPSSDSHVKPQ
jgi:poly-D-alanine transfer protein DltD